MKHAITVLAILGVLASPALARYECEGSGCRGTRRFEILDHSKQHVVIGYEAVMDATCQDGRRHEFSVFYITERDALNYGTNDVLSEIRRANCSPMSLEVSIYEVRQQI